MSSLIKMFCCDNGVIAYRPEIAREIGINASILLAQVAYWHGKIKGKFYKFLQPCEHVLYKKGDSWTEELGFTITELRNALKKLEKLELVRKKTNLNRVTHYYLNEKNLKKLLENIYVNNESLCSSKITKPNLPYTETTTETTTHIAKACNNSKKDLDISKEVLDAYHKILPDLPRVARWTKPRDSKLRARNKFVIERLKEKNQEPTKENIIKWYEVFFIRFSENEFYAKGSSNGWKANIDWILTESNFIKRFEAITSGGR